MTTLSQHAYDTGRTIGAKYVSMILTGELHDGNVQMLATRLPADIFAIIPRECMDRSLIDEVQRGVHDELILLAMPLAQVLAAGLAEIN